MHPYSKEMRKFCLADKTVNSFVIAVYMPMMCWRNGVLVNWKNDDLFSSGKDIHNVMLILMTYMGHQSIAATNKYVRIVETMFPEIVRQVDMAHNHIFPNMDEMTD